MLQAGTQADIWLVPTRMTGRTRMGIVAVRILARWTLLALAVARLSPRICLVLTFAARGFVQTCALARLTLVLVHGTGSAWVVPSSAEPTRRTVLALAIGSLGAI